jgi:DNA replication protein DnaC
MSRPLRKTLNKKSLSLIGIPKTFIGYTIEDFIAKSSELRDVKEFVRDYIDRLDYNFDNNKGIFFCGSNGVGKTMLSCIILKEAYRHRYSCRRSTFVEYIDKYTRVWSSKNSDEKELFEDDLYTYYKAVEFLVLEEIGKEIDSKVAAPILEDLLRYREDNGLVTILCTNLNTDTLLERYGESCMSLLKGNTIPITIQCKDKRNSAFKKRIRPFSEE